MAWEFLRPILTPAALLSIQANASPLLTLLLVYIGLTTLCVLVWYIHFRTSKAYPATKKKDNGGGGLKKKGGEGWWWVGRLRLRGWMRG
ncbi:hypothetical protein EJ05DRAFT_476656 [Pseudovirgaria hyperparasitica]|uniref:Uncharacterized protein n=1 Tax=Pseudovirgaria hyperparasitica TaxID=470096 RepID=A0A6A6W611_9PEZI|nr:uncharacterized protein EJ05DRAFT_476656 [Pseudovirgaria hyperparasitica]KAF2757390.1 hypothetical protein EJ05DRAFT_476656 [Pseudovirgaria hyperparasitica]